jgi:hypothetical protein
LSYCRVLEDPRRTGVPPHKNLRGGINMFENVRHITIRLNADPFHGEWNYSISPRKEILIS